MKKKLLIPCLLLSVLMILTCTLAFGVGAEETLTMTEVAAGDKTPVEGDVVTIANATELKAFSAYVSAGGATAGITFKLDNSIDAEVGIKIEMLDNDKQTNFNPIGGVYNGTTPTAVPFLGTFDGNGKTVSGLIFTDRYFEVDGTYVDSGANTENLGFFALLGEGSVVKNLTLSIKEVQNVAGPYFGMLASKANGATVENCAVIGDDATRQQALGFKNGFVAVGALVGYAKDSVIDGCKANVKINANGGSVAGIVGVAQGATEIADCVVGGTYTHTAASYIGGIVAKLEGTSSVKNCYSYATLTTEITSGDYLLGGIAAYVGSGATVENCSSMAILAAKENVAGFLVGKNDGTVKDSYSLRDANASGKHIDVASGTGENLFAFMPQMVGDVVTSYRLGKVEGGEITCPDCNGTGRVNGSRCTTCNGRRKIQVPYEFAALTTGNTELSLALNAWVAANGTDKYVSWTLAGKGVINCNHNVRAKYVAYSGQAPDCTHTGIGDKYCSICEELLASSAVVPVDSTKHTQALYACQDYACERCGTPIASVQNHSIDPQKLCGKQECSVCHETVLPEKDPETGKNLVPHVRPEGVEADPDKPCLEFTCVNCGDEHAKDTEHEMPEIDFPCREGVKCTKCGLEVAPTANHRPGLQATCTRTQYCRDCGKMMRAAKGHTLGDPATCGTAQTCVDCGYEAVPATGDHVYDRHADGNAKIPAADCLNDSVCVQCGYVGQMALGHSVLKTTATCGLGKTCKRCSAVVVSASGDHIIDLDRATVVRSATAGRSGIVEGICLDCGRKVEAYVTSAVMEKTGNVLISGGSFTFYAGNRVEAVFGAVADYKELDYKRGYIPLQVVTLSLVDAAGGELSLPGGATIKIALNKSAAKLDADAFRFYKVGEEGVLTEVALTGVEDGFLVFEASELGTFVLAADEDAAFDVLGTVAAATQPQQTAALIGTAAYERRDFEI